MSLAAALVFTCESIEEVEAKAKRCPKGLMVYVRGHWDEWHAMRSQAVYPQTRA